MPDPRQWGENDFAKGTAKQKRHHIHVTMNVRTFNIFKLDDNISGDDGDDNHEKWQKCKFVYEFPSRTTQRPKGEQPS